MKTSARGPSNFHLSPAMPGRSNNPRVPWVSEEFSRNLVKDMFQILSEPIHKELPDPNKLQRAPKWSLECPKMPTGPTMLAQSILAPHPEEVLLWSFVAEQVHACITARPSNSRQTQLQSCQAKDSHSKTPKARRRLESNHFWDSGREGPLVRDNTRALGTNQVFKRGYRRTIYGGYMR